jgi:hypothetical protein
MSNKDIMKEALVVGLYNDMKKSVICGKKTEQDAIDDFHDIINNQDKHKKKLEDELYKNLLDVYRQRNLDSCSDMDAYNRAKSYLSAQMLMVLKNINTDVLGELTEEEQFVKNDMINVYLRATKQSKIFIPEKDVIELLKLTTIKEKLPLNFPFYHTFVSTLLEIDNKIIYGFMLCEFDVISKTTKECEYKQKRLFVSGYDPEDECNFYIDEVLTHDFPEEDAFIIGDQNKRFSRDDMKYTRRVMLRIAKNFCHYLNTKDALITTVERTKEQNDKRIKRGKSPIPTLHYVKVSEEMRIYLDKLKSSVDFSYSHKFWVRGHFRTLRNEERYGDNAGVKLWIKPYVKGKGMLIDKKYVVE